MIHIKVKPPLRYVASLLLNLTYEPSFNAPKPNIILVMPDDQGSPAVEAHEHPGL